MVLFLLSYQSFLDLVLIHFESNSDSFLLFTLFMNAPLSYVMINDQIWWKIYGKFGIDKVFLQYDFYNVSLVLHFAQIFSGKLTKSKKMVFLLYEFWYDFSSEWLSWIFFHKNIYVQAFLEFSNLFLVQECSKHPPSSKSRKKRFSNKTEFVCN